MFDSTNALNPHVEFNNLHGAIACLDAAHNMLVAILNPMVKRLEFHKGNDDYYEKLDGT